jgi:hypothetical protein
MRPLKWDRIMARASLTFDSLEWVWEFLDIFEEVFEEHKARYTRTDGHHRQNPKNYVKRVSHDLKLPTERLIKILNRDYTPTLHEIVMYNNYWDNKLIEKWTTKIDLEMANNLHKTKKKRIYNNIKPKSNANPTRYTEPNSQPIFS